MIIKAMLWGTLAMVALCAAAALAIIGWVGVQVGNYYRSKRQARLHQLFDPMRPLRRDRA